MDYYRSVQACSFRGKTAVTIFRRVLRSTIDPRSVHSYNDLTQASAARVERLVRHTNQPYLSLGSDWMIISFAFDGRLGEKRI